MGLSYLIMCCTRSYHKLSQNLLTSFKRQINGFKQLMKQDTTEGIKRNLMKTIVIFCDKHISVLYFPHSSYYFIIYYIVNANFYLL